MSVAGAHDVVAAHVVIFAGQEAVHVTRGDAQRAHHDGHGGGEVFAMAGALLEKEVGQGIGGRSAAEVQRVAVIVAKIAFHGAGLVIRIEGSRGDCLGQRRDARIELGQLQIGVAKRLGIGLGRSAQSVGGHFGQLGDRVVTQGFEIVERIGQRAGFILGEIGAAKEAAGQRRAEKIAVNALGFGSHEDGVGSDRLEHHRILRAAANSGAPREFPGGR